MSDYLENYNFFYPDDLVALSPLAKKDHANMLVFKENSFSHQKVFDLLKHISENDLLVFNNTKVLPCRLIGQRVRLEQEITKTKVSVTLNKVIDQNVWTTFCKPLKKLKEGDKIYAFSDGYPDQFGGERGKKFMYKKFKELLVETVNESMEDQKRKLEDRLFQWMGSHEQVDDIVIFGVEID